MRPGLAWQKAPKMAGQRSASWSLVRWDGSRWHDEGAVVRDHFSAARILKGWVVLTPATRNRQPFQPNRLPVAVFRTLAEAKAFAVAEAEARPVTT